MEILLFVTKWMKQMGVMLREISHSQQQKYHIYKEFKIVIETGHNVDCKRLGVMGCALHLMLYL